MNTADEESDFDDASGLPEMPRMEFLKTEAEIIADKGGHDMGPWNDESGWAWAVCGKCGGKISVAEHPPAKAPAVQHLDSFMECK